MVSVCPVKENARAAYNVSTYAKLFSLTALMDLGLIKTYLALFDHNIDIAFCPPYVPCYNCPSQSTIFDRAYVLCPMIDY